MCIQIHVRLYRNECGWYQLVPYRNEPRFVLQLHIFSFNCYHSRSRCAVRIFLFSSFFILFFFCYYRHQSLNLSKRTVKLFRRDNFKNREIVSCDRQVNRIFNILYLNKIKNGNTILTNNISMIAIIWDLSIKEEIFENSDRK